MYNISYHIQVIQICFLKVEHLVCPLKNECVHAACLKPFAYEKNYDAMPAWIL